VEAAGLDATAVLADFAGSLESDFGSDFVSVEAGLSPSLFAGSDFAASDFAGSDFDVDDSDFRLSLM
jgi:hypothetical protein